MKPDTPERYGTISRLLHWGMAVLVIWQVLKVFDRIDDGEHWVGQTLVPWHVSIGTLILLLVLIRIGWALRNRRQRPPAPQPPLLGFVARAGHVLLYVALVAMPVTGISLLVGNGFGLEAFGLQLIPRGEEIAWLAALGSNLHVPLAWLLIVLVVGHLGAALWHHFVRRDGVLRRML